MPAGYSGTPLFKKLGIRTADTVTLLGEPDGFRDLLIDLPDAVTFRERLSGSPNLVIAFILDTSLVDVKVCAISEVWSGLKAVWRKDLR